MGLAQKGVVGHQFPRVSVALCLRLACGFGERGRGRAWLCLVELPSFLERASVQLKNLPDCAASQRRCGHNDLPPQIRSVVVPGGGAMNRRVAVARSAWSPQPGPWLKSMAFQSAPQAGQPSNSVCDECPYFLQRKTRSRRSLVARNADV
jgi:hypothetical protein